MSGYSRGATDSVGEPRRLHPPVLERRHRQALPARCRADRRRPLDTQRDLPDGQLECSDRIALASLADFILRYWKDVTDKRCPRGAERIAVAPLTHKETCPMVSLNVLCMHGHVADQKNRSPGIVDCIRHERTERISRALSGDG